FTVLIHEIYALFPYTTLFRSGGEAVAVRVHPEDALVLGPTRGEDELAREAAGAPGERTEQRVRDAMRGDAHLVLSDEEALLIDRDRKSTRLNSSHVKISYAVF